MTASAGLVSTAPVPDFRGGARRVAEPALGRPAALGLVGMVALVVGSVLGGSAFVSHMPGAWFFATPGGPLGSWVPPGKNPPVYALLLVFGGLIVLTRAWLGLLRQLWRGPGSRCARW